MCECVCRLLYVVVVYCWHLSFSACAAGSLVKFCHDCDCYCAATALPSVGVERWYEKGFPRANRAVVYKAKYNNLGGSVAVGFK